jgi:hypothetical protein
VPDATDERCGLLVVSRSEREDDELVAPDTRDCVAGADDGLEPARQTPENGVARSMPAHVVHVLEAVQVDDDERKRLLRSLRATERLLDPVLEQRSIGEPRQRVA